MGQPLELWHAQSLRVTAFPATIAEIPEVSWWTSLVAEPPETRTSRPREGGLVEEGVVQGGKLRLEILPIKIDWHHVVAHPEQVGQGIPSLGTFPEAIEVFVPLMRKWLKEMCPKVNRLAFAGIIFQPVDNHETGYQTLGKYLHAVKIDPLDSSDFSYRINRPRQSKIAMPGLKLNRLTSWSVMRVQTQFYSGQRVLVQDLNLRACRVDFDINTSHEYQGELPSTKLIDVLDELVSEAKEIAIEGEIK